MAIFILKLSDELIHKIEKTDSGTDASLGFVPEPEIYKARVFFRVWVQTIHELSRIILSLNKPMKTEGLFSIDDYNS